MEDNKILSCLLFFFPFGTKTAALAQKNSEATRALAVQGDILEKELGEIQKVLLAMQVTFMTGKNKNIWVPAPSSCLIKTNFH